MRVMWINAGLLPEACAAIGHGVQVTAGWINSQLQALLNNGPKDNQYFILSLDYRTCDVQIGNVHHRSFGIKRGLTYGEKVSFVVEKQAEAAIKAFRPDVIHIHGSEYFFGRMSEAVYSGCPRVLSIQGILTPYAQVMTGNLVPNQMFWHQFNLKRFRYNSTIFNDQIMWEKKRVPQEKKVFAVTRYFMGRTDWDKAWAYTLHPKAKYFHVNETLRAPFYREQSRDESKVVRHTIYCSAAAGYSLKGAHVLFYAIAYLKQKYPDIQLRVCAAEKLNRKRSLNAILHDDQYGSYLRTLIGKLCIEKQVLGLPYLTGDDVARELEKAEIFVLPSFCENSPNSLGEAQLIGVPAISTYAGGTPSMLQNGEEGILVQPGDPAVLAAAIDDYFSNPAKARAYAAKARETALMRHDPKRNAERTLEVYKAVIEDSKRDR